MRKVLKHKVTFYSPGTFFNEQSTREIDSWDIKKALEIAGTITERYGAKPFGFRFTTWETLEGAELEDFHVDAKKVKESGTIYWNGIVRTAAEVLAGTDPDESILRSNVRGNELPAVVQGNDPNNYKWTQEFMNTDLLVDKDGVVLAGTLRECLKYGC